MPSWVFLVAVSAVMSACSLDRINHDDPDGAPGIDAEPADGSGPSDVALDASPPSDAGPDLGDAAEDLPDVPAPDADAAPDAAPDAGPMPDANTFPPRINALTADNCTPALNHRPLTQGDSGALVTTSSSVFYSGDRSARFDLGLTFAAPLDSSVPNGRYQALVSDLRTGVAYTLANDDFPLDGPSPSPATQIWRIDPLTGATIGAPTALSRTITFGNGGHNGIFSGWGFAIFHTGDHVYEVALPSGAVTDLGPMGTLRPDSTGCPTFAVWGVAESFGGRRYLVAPFKPTLPVVQIKRHRVPDGATAVVGEFTSLGNACSIALSPSTGRWYTQWVEQSSLGGGPGTDSIAACDADLSPAPGDGIVDYPGVAKRPFNQAWGPLRPLGGTYAFANSFVASSTATYVERLGLWLEDPGHTGGSQLVLQVWADGAAGAPDPSDVIASTAVLRPPAQDARQYVDAQVVTWTRALVSGQRYWFVASVVGFMDPGQWSVARHAHNSDGVVDDGVFRISNHRQAQSFDPIDNTSRNEMALTVRLGASAFDGGGGGPDASADAGP